MSTFAVSNCWSTMKKILLALVIALVCSCAQREVNIVPYPNDIAFRHGIYDVSKTEVVCVVDVDSSSLINIASFAENIGAELMMSDASKFVTGTVAVVDGGFNVFAM